MKAQSIRLTMSFIVTLGLALSRASAQAPLVPASQMIDPNPITPLPAILQRPITPGPAPHFPIANKHGYLCGADNEWMGCGNWATEFRFVFGSCRQFFVEPCAPIPPILYNDGTKNFLPNPGPTPPRSGWLFGRSTGGGGGCGSPGCLLSD
jgi:hypothetical protein